MEDEVLNEEVTEETEAAAEAVEELPEEKLEEVSGGAEKGKETFPREPTGGSGSDGKKLSPCCGANIQPSSLAQKAAGIIGICAKCGKGIKKGA